MAAYLVPGPRVELGTPASSGQRSTDELGRQDDSLKIGDLWAWAIGPCLTYIFVRLAAGLGPRPHLIQF